jgi:hypothetical protein
MILSGFEIIIPIAKNETAIQRFGYVYQTRLTVKNTVGKY